MKTEEYITECYQRRHPIPEDNKIYDEFRAGVYAGLLFAHNIKEGTVIADNTAKLNLILASVMEQYVVQGVEIECTKKYEAVIVKQMYVKIARDNTSATWQMIGDVLGQSHSNTINTYSRACDRIKYDKFFRSDFEKVEKYVKQIIKL